MKKQMRLILAVIGCLGLCLSLQAQAIKNKPKTAAVPAVQVTQAARSSILKYIPDDVVLVVAAQPARVIKSKGLQELIAASEAQDLVDELIKSMSQNTGMDPDTIQEFAIVLDREMIAQMSGVAEQQTRRMEDLNSLKQIALAMHNYHDTYGSFPAVDGSADSQGNLSWRVFLLPFLEESDLYEQFRLDEPWDSEHNKALVEKMPDVFRTPGAKEPGRTSLHLLTGDGTPFDAENAPTLAEITDGTSNTIMAVIGGGDTAEVWTKPGGLKIDADDPSAALGEIGEQFAVCFLDGAVSFLRADLDSEELLHLMQSSDGFPVFGYGVESGSPPLMPGFVFRCSVPVDQSAVLNTIPFSPESEEVEIAGIPAVRVEQLVFVFPDAQTMLFGSEETVTAMIAKRTKSGKTKAKLEELYPNNDLAAAADLEPLADLLQEMTGEFPMAGVLQNVRTVALSTDFTGGGKSLHHLDAEMGSRESAQQLTALATGLYQMQKAQVLAMTTQENSAVSEQLADMLAALMDSVAISAEGTKVQLDVPRPEDPQSLLKEMAPALQEVMKGFRASMMEVKRQERLNNLRMIGLAFHNYHDLYNGFPSFNTGRAEEAENEGLSWRVHLLPFIDAALYAEFHLDEPWDSEHNKTLIERMPDVFACEGVDEPGHTAIHVFLGEETPFGGEKPLGMQNILDGTSNTIMAVEAGPDRGEVWTKPGGLKFDAENPGKALGRIGETFMALLCDGSARFISREIDETTLSRLIQHADGNPLGDF